MTSQEEWRRIAYERSVGESGNNSMGTMANQQGYQNYLARQEAARVSWSPPPPVVPAWTPPPVTPSSPPAAGPVGAVAPYAGTFGPASPPPKPRELGPFERKIAALEDIADITDLEDFWCASDWLFKPVVRRVPRLLVWAVLGVSAMASLAYGFLGGAVLGELAVWGVLGFLAPAAAYLALRVAVSTVTLAAIWALFLGFVGVIGVAALGALYVVVRVLLAIFA